MGRAEQNRDEPADSDRGPTGRCAQSYPGAERGRKGYELRLIPKSYSQFRNTFQRARTKAAE